MFIIVWLISLMVIALLIGEIRFRQVRKVKHVSKKINSRKWTDSIDEELDGLDIESYEEDFVPTTKLMMRGSWRLAQNMVMSSSSFEELKNCEYDKRLR